MRDGEANTLRRERQSADGRGHLEHALGTLAAARKRLLARRPRDRAVRADRHMVDPAALAVGGDHRALAVRVGRHHLAVVAAGDDAVGVGASSTEWRRRAPPPCARRPFSARAAASPRPARTPRSWPRKCAATTGASALTGRVRSTTEGISFLAVGHATPLTSPRRVRLRGSALGSRRSLGRNAHLRHARQLSKPCRILSSGRLRPMKTRRLSRFSPGLPRPLVVAVEDHVHALEHEALVVILEGEDALAAQNARPLFLHEVLHPREELVGVERLVGPQRDRLHLLVVIVLQPPPSWMMAVAWS